MSISRRFACVFLLTAAPALAQSPLEPSRLPPDTLFYLHWRGTASLEAAQSTNSLLRLWADPQFAPAREALMEDFYGTAKQSKPLEQWTSKELAQAIQLLENPFEIGFVGRPEIPVGANREREGTRLADSVAFFMVFDTTGKVVTLQKLKESGAAAAKDRETVTRYTFGATTVERVAGPRETYYRASVERYVIRASQQALLEDLITRLESSQTSTASLGQAADFQAAQRQMGSGGVLQVFGRIRDLSWSLLPGEQGFDSRAFAHSLRLENLHTICGSASFESRATRLHMALLGDASAGGVFDAFGESSPAFATLALAPAGTASYNAGHLNLAALYRTLRSAMLAALPPKQRTNLEAFETITSSWIGREEAAAYELLSGEITAITTVGDFNPFSQLYAATIERPADVLRVLRGLLAAEIVNEEREGNTTYFTVYLHFTPSPAEGQRRHFFYIGVTPKMLIAGPGRTLVHEAAARLAAERAATGASLASDTGFRQGRARLPESLSSVGYIDFSRAPWEKLAEIFSDPGGKSEEQSSPSGADARSIWKLIPPAVLRRYLHSLTSGSWKDQDGVYFDAYVE